MSTRDTDHVKLSELAYGFRADGPVGALLNDDADGFQTLVQTFSQFVPRVEERKREFHNDGYGDGKRHTAESPKIRDDESGLRACLIPGWNGEDDDDCEGRPCAVIGHRTQAVKGNKKAKDHPEEMRQRIIHQEDRSDQQEGGTAKKAGNGADTSAQRSDRRLT